MAYIAYVSAGQLPASERVPDADHIIQVHAIHPVVMRRHWELYRELMHGPGPLLRREREVMAVRVSGLNDCPY